MKLNSGMLCGLGRDAWVEEATELTVTGDGRLMSSAMDVDTWPGRVAHDTLLPLSIFDTLPDAARRPQDPGSCTMPTHLSISILPPTQSHRYLSCNDYQRSSPRRTLPRRPRSARLQP